MQHSAPGSRAGCVRTRGMDEAQARASTQTRGVGAPGGAQRQRPHWQASTRTCPKAPRGSWRVDAHRLRGPHRQRWRETHCAARLPRPKRTRRCPAWREWNPSRHAHAIADLSVDATGSAGATRGGRSAARKARCNCATQLARVATRWPMRQQSICGALRLAIGWNEFSSVAALRRQLLCRTWHSPASRRVERHVAGDGQ